MRKTRPSLPTRGCANSTGRPVSTRIQSAIAASTGLNDDERRRGEHAVERVLQRARRACSRASEVTDVSSPQCVSRSSILRARRRRTTTALRARSRVAATPSICSRLPFRSGPFPRRSAIGATSSSCRSAAGYSRAIRARAARFVVKGLEYLPSVRRLSRRLRELEPDVVHVQWLALPRLDVRWLRRVAAGAADGVHGASRVAARRRREGRRAAQRLRHRAARDRALAARVDDLAALGVARERIAYIPHAVFESARRAEPDAADRLDAALLRPDPRVQGDRRARTRARGACRTRGSSSPAIRSIPSSRLQELARELGVDDAHRVAARLPARRRGRALMRDATLVVLPYLRTDASGVLATAIGHGRPVVVTRRRLARRDRPRVRARRGRAARRRARARRSVPAAALRSRAPRARRSRGRGRRAKALTWDAAAAEHERVYADAQLP